VIDGCFDERTVMALARGDLVGAPHAQAIAHLDGCDACRDLLATALLAEDADGAADDNAAAVALGATVDGRAVAHDVTVAAGPRVRRPSASTAVRDPSGYRLGPELARGGMGRVLIAEDLRLGREVAVKQLLDDSPALRQRFEREIRITATLQHPGIVPVYQAGTAEDGAPFYAMRRIHGRSFDVVIAEATTVAARLALLPRFLVAAEAIAYAHARRVIHRDLKPHNILIGEFGEVVVVDWGLAKRLDAADDDAAPLAPLAPARSTAVASALTQAGAVMGTPAYMAPEQASGDPADSRSDVFALGAVLYHLLSGGPPYAGTGRTLEDIVAGRIVPLAQRTPDVPADLSAIVTRAMAIDPVARYADAGALVADVQTFLAGKLVSAHDYSLAELVRRRVRAWRWQIAVTTIALIALVTTIAWWRIEAQRRRAVVAERATAHALVRTHDALGEVLAVRAAAALATGAVAEAEVLATASLAEVDSPDARGVLAATTIEPHPRRGQRVDLPGCEAVLTATTTTAVCNAAAGVELWQLAPPIRRWRQPFTASEAMTIGDDAVVLVIGGTRLVIVDAATGQERRRHESGRMLELVRPALADRLWFHDNITPFALDLTTGHVTQNGRACGADRMEAMAVGPRLRVAACRDGRVMVARDDGDFVVAGTSALVGPSEVASVLALSPDGARLALGGIRGTLQVIELAPWRPRPARSTRDGRITQVLFVGDQVAVLGEHGAGALWPIDGDRIGLRIPAAANRELRLVGDSLVATGAGWWRWQLDDDDRLRGWRHPLGVTGLAVAPRTGVVAAGHPDGSVEVVTATGSTTLAITPGPAKDVAFDDRGEVLAVAVAAVPGLRVFAAPAWTPLPAPLDSAGTRQIAFLGDGSARAFLYAAQALRWRDGVATVAPGPYVSDVRRVRGRDGLVAIDVAGELLELTSTAVTRLGHDDGGSSIAALPDGRLAVGHAGGVRVLAGGSEVAWLPTDGVRVIDIDVSPDGRWLVAGCVDGAIRVWSTVGWRLTGVLRGHQQRVSAVAFGDDGVLWSGAWDGQVRAWDLGPLDRDVAALRADAEARWALPLAMVR